MSLAPDKNNFHLAYKIEQLGILISGQYGSIDRYSMPPYTTKRMTAGNFKIKNNQNCQEIELYGSMKTKELKKKHSFRPVGGVEMGSSGGDEAGESSGWRTAQGRWLLEDGAVPHLLADKPGGTTGE